MGETPEENLSLYDLFLETDRLIENNDSCDHVAPPMIAVRFGLVTVVGSIVAFIGVVENLLLLYLFVSRKHHRTSYNQYMMFLAMFDSFVCGAYIPLMSVNVLGDYLVDPFLINIWYSYMRPIYTISHIGLTASTFLIVAATFERYCITMNSRMLKWVQKNRLTIACFAGIMGILAKGTIGYELLYETKEQCIGTAMEIGLTYRKFVFMTSYHQWMRIWCRNATVIVPFIIIVILNFLIINALRRQPQMTVCSQLAGPAANDISKRKSSQSMVHLSDIEYAKRKKSMIRVIEANSCYRRKVSKMARRNATKSLVLVGCCYLFSNLFPLITLIWEQNDPEDKRNTHEYYSKIYALIIDVGSLLSVVACVFRLPIQLACQMQLREEVKTIIHNIFCCQFRKKDDHERLMTSGQSSNITHENGFENNNLPEKSFGLTLGGNGIGFPSSAKLKEDFCNGKHFSVDGIQIYFHNGNETLL